MKKKHFLRAFLSWSMAGWSVLCMTGAGVLLAVLNWFFPLHVSVSYSPILYSSEGTMLRAFLSADDKWRMKAELAEITPELRTIMLQKEDRFFYWHPGINPLAIVRALTNNVLKGRRTSGASTITMQVARLLYPKERTYANKIVEMFRALQLEWHYSKDEILQLYLNLIPYGSNIEGVKSASVLYFGRPPEQLSLAQTMSLAIIPNRPTSLSLVRHQTAIIRERNRWLRLLAAEKVFDPKDIEDALLEPLDARRQPLPQKALHAAQWLRSRHPHQANIHTTIRAGIQEKVEQLAYSYIQKQKQSNIHNASVIVVDNATRAIVAYLGSPDFEDVTHSGQVDGTRAIRSPGSALKPLVYALAFDQGAYTPKMVLEDVPTDFDGYAPENFDRKFNGKVTVETALGYSLNVTAVRVLQDIGVQSMIESLKEAGFRRIARDEPRLGLSLALGGCGVTLQEMAGLYAAIADRGLYRPLHLIGKPDTTGRRLMSPAAAYMLTEILSKLERPDLPNNFANTTKLPKVAWKTGTSYGRRDAWSIGYNRRYTIAVWLGNFSGESIPDLTGAGTATPLLFQLFNTIDYGASGDWFGMPDDLQFRLVCHETGLVPEDFCEHQVMDYFIPGVSPNRHCTHRKLYFISADEKYTYCTHCLPAGGYKKSWFDHHSPEMIAYFQAQQIPYRPVPPHFPDCDRPAQGTAPVIISPVPDKVYTVNEAAKTEFPLTCRVAPDVRQVYWYVNDQFVQKTDPATRLFTRLPRGKVKISCSDDLGRNTDVWVEVR